MISDQKARPFRRKFLQRRWFNGDKVNTPLRLAGTTGGGPSCPGMRDREAG